MRFRSIPTLSGLTSWLAASKGRSVAWALLIVVATSGLGACAPDARQTNAGIAREVLKRAGPGSEFVDASTAAQAAVRHAPSGMVCVLPQKGAFDMGQFPADAANPGAYCSRAAEGLATTLISVKFRRATTLDTAFTESVSTALAAKQAKLWTGRPSAADLEPATGLPHFRIARFIATVDGAPHYFRMSMSEANGWYLQQIATAPVDRAEKAEAIFGQDWRALLRASTSTPHK